MPVQTLDSSDQVTRFGAGALEDIGELAAQQGMENVLVIVDPNLYQAGRKALARLDAAGLRSRVSHAVTPTPLIAQAEALARGDHDGVISIGGGSAIDMGKAAAILGRNPVGLHDLAHGKAFADRAWPHIAVPTTAGTGAESSSYAFFVDQVGREHTILHGPLLRPQAVIIDPELHVSMPPHVTAATGLNALTDAVEALLGSDATEASNKDAKEAIAAIMANLPRAVSHGGDLDARSAMAKASYQAGLAFDVAGLGIVDSIALVLSGIYAVGHSEAAAMVLPHVLDHRHDDRVAAVIPGGGQAVRELAHQCGFRRHLADLGLGWDDVYVCANSIARHPFARRANPPVDRGDIASILAAALEEEPPARRSSAAP